MDDNVYLNSPLAYLPGLEDDYYLERYWQREIIICSRQGVWENGREDARAINAILEAKGVACWLDLWGHGVNHDWLWWRRQMSYFLGSLDLQPVACMASAGDRASVQTCGPPSVDMVTARS